MTTFNLYYQIINSVMHCRIHFVFTPTSEFQYGFLSSTAFKALLDTHFPHGVDTAHGAAIGADTYESHRISGQVTLWNNYSGLKPLAGDDYLLELQLNGIGNGDPREGCVCWSWFMPTF